MLKGSIVALITPFFEDYNIDYESFKNLIHMHNASSTDAFLIAGSTGEGHSLSLSEINELVSIAKTHSSKPVIVGVSAAFTKQAISLVRAASMAGANACLVSTPYYVLPTQEGLRLHFEEIAKNSDIPIILYNIPKRTGVDLEINTINRLSKLDRIIGIKETNCNMSRIKDIKEYSNFCILSGNDECTLDFMKAGAKGVISVAANIAPLCVSKLCKFALDGNFKKAKKCNEDLSLLYEHLSIQTNPIVIKWICYINDLIKTPTLRLPLTTLSDIYKERIDKSCINKNYIKMPI